MARTREALIRAAEAGIRDGLASPDHQMTQILMHADLLTTDLQRKHFLRLQQPIVNPNGGYRYDLLLDKTEAGERCLTLSLVPDSQMGAATSADFEAQTSRIVNRRKEPLRTGYLHVSESAVRDIRPVGIVPDTTAAMEDLLRLHFPDHQVTVKDPDS